MIAIGILLIIIFGARWLYLIINNDEDDKSDYAKRQRKQKELIPAVMTILGLIISVVGIASNIKTPEVPTSVQIETSLPKDTQPNSFEVPNITSSETTTTPTVDSDTTTIKSITTINSNTTLNTTKSNNNLYTIPSLYKNNLTIDSIKNKETSINNVDFIIYYGFLGYEGQVDEYSIIPRTSGKYRFDISNTLSSTKITIKILNSAGNTIADTYSITSNQGISATLESGLSYIIQVKQVSGIDNYTLTIGQPKESVDISNYTIINDSIEFKNQMNVYFFTPSIDGRYRFNFSELQHGIKLSLGIYDSKDNEIKYSSNLENGNGITADLIANEEYTIKVCQNGDFGRYILNIGKQKDVIDISNYTQIIDNIEFKNQQNLYTYTPQIDGHYYIYFTEIINGSDMNFFVENRLGEKLRNNTYTIYNNDGVSYDLKGGEQYIIYVTQRNNYSLYQMNIGTQKETISITPHSQIKDSVEYKTQQNNYLFTPDTSSNYKLNFENMKSEFTLNVIVLDGLNYKISENSYVDNKESIELKDLVAGQTYTIQITQKSQYGEYTFSIS